MKNRLLLLSIFTLFVFNIFAQNKTPSVSPQAVADNGLSASEILNKLESAVTSGKGLSSLTSVSYSWQNIYRGTYSSVTENTEYRISDFGVSRFKEGGGIDAITIDGSWSFSGNEEYGYHISNDFPQHSPGDLNNAYSAFSCLQLVTGLRNGISLVGRETEGYKTQYRFKAKLSDRVDYHYWLDSETFLPVKSATYVDSQEEALTHIKSSTRIDGFWFPTEEVTKLKTGDISTLTYKILNVNEDLTRYFKRPNADSLNAAANHSKKLPFSTLLQFKTDDSMEQTQKYLTDNKIKMTLANQGEYDFIRIGVGKMNRIVVAEIADVTFDFVEFGFENKRLKSLTLARENPDFIGEEDLGLESGCQKVDQMLSEKNGSKPVPLSYWIRPSRSDYEKVWKKERNYKNIKANLNSVTSRMAQLQHVWFHHVILGEIAIAFKSPNLFK